ncbi:Bromodomain-containing protein [Abortiporus biennis]|nr:Bromodomain-containing protein [Abortiporus biennis]
MSRIASIPINPPKGTPPPLNGDLLEDVKMAEEPSSQASDVQMTDAVAPPPSVNGLPNGHSHIANHDHSPVATSGSAIPAVSSSNTAVDSLAASSPYSNDISPNDDDVQPPPAKRARKYSDAEKASIANTATPPPVSVSPPPTAQATAPPTAIRTHTGPPTLSASQHRFCTSTIRTLKKLKDAAPFLRPVDYVAMNIPHYPTIIKQPMDFSTIERKLASSNPSKPDPNPANPRYYHADEFITDVRLIFSNCLTFNGPEHPITQMGKRIEAVFDKQIKQIPPPEEMKPLVAKKLSTPPPPPAAKKPMRKASTSVPTIRRNEEGNASRPKREIHPPPPKDLPYVNEPKKTRKGKGGLDSRTAEQLRFCDKVLKELHKKTHYAIASPFYDPVDWVKLEIPSYPKLIKKPMDLSTMRKKLDAGEYPTADKFHDDFKLMIRNCFTFNPSGTPVNLCGQQLQRLFEEKWQNLPTAEGSDEEYDEDMEEDDEESTKARMIAQMESQIQSMSRELEGLKKTKGKDEKKKEKKKEKKEKHVPVASTSKAPPKPAKTSTNSKKTSKTLKKPIADDDVLSFEQKKDLSEAISQLDGVKLERVIQIIHEGVPEIRDSTEEIELEVDQLPAAVLTKLYNFVIRPMRPPPAKRSRTGKGTGTGGLKRKSMDEDVEAEKIRVLEERMALFSNPGGKATSATTAAHQHAAAEDSDHSSDSSSGSDSSGSDSE